MRVAEHMTRLALWTKGYRSNRVDTAAGRVHYMVRKGGGELPPVVLLHGLGSAGAHFGPLLRHLRRQVQKIIIIDFPGHGFSRHANVKLDADLFRSSVEEVLDKLIQEPVILYGNSLGGMAALRYTLVKPKFIHRLVVCSPGGAPMTPIEKDALFSLFEPLTHEACLEFVDRLLAKRYGTRHLFGVGIRFALKDKTVQSLLHSLDDTLMLTPEEVSTLSVPTLCVWGKADGILPKSGADFFQKNLPQSKVQFSCPEDFGHSPHLEFPRRVAEQIIRFVRGEAVET
jgi:pimeloyl-ACP methyl ester carboxylesterase